MLSRQLRERFGDTPQARQNLIIALQKVAEVHRALSQAALEEATEFKKLND